jgi:hypothetical protein
VNLVSNLRSGRAKNLSNSFPFLTKIWASEQMYLITFHVNLSRGSHAGTRERTGGQLDRRTDMTKLMDVFRVKQKRLKI